MHAPSTTIDNSDLGGAINAWVATQGKGERSLGRFTVNFATRQLTPAAADKQWMANMHWTTTKAAAQHA